MKLVLLSAQDAELLLVVACLAACGAAWESFESRPGDMMSLYNSYPAKNRAKYPYFYMGKPVPRYSEQSHSKPVYPSHDPISSSYSKSYQHEYNHLPTAPHKYSKYPERPPHRYYQPEPQYPKQSGYVYHFISIPPSPYYKSPSPSYQKTIPRPPLHQQPYQNIPPLSESSQQLPTPTVPTKPPTVATTTDKPTTIGTIQPDILVTPATLFTPVMDFIPIADDQNAVVEGEAPIDDDADDIAADEVDIFGQVDLPDEKAEDTTEVPNSAEETTSTTEGISGNETELEKPLLNAVAEEEVAILPSPVTTQLPIPSLIVTEVYGCFNSEFKIIQPTFLNAHAYTVRGNRVTLYSVSTCHAT